MKPDASNMPRPIPFASPDCGPLHGLALFDASGTASIQVVGLDPREAESVADAVKAGGSILAFTPAQMETLRRMVETYESVTPGEYGDRLDVLAKIQKAAPRRGVRPE